MKFLRKVHADVVRLKLPARGDPKIGDHVVLYINGTMVVESYIESVHDDLLTLGRFKIREDTVDIEKSAIKKMGPSWVLKRNVK